jgi:serine/arginine repetitive matrix protein 2
MRYVKQMIGGGRIRRRSLNSFVEGSPIFVHVGKRKPPVLRGQHRNVIRQPDEIVLSPHTDQTVEKSPHGLGEGRMISARQGLLSRNSLEELCLCADGVDACERIPTLALQVAPCSLAHRFPSHRRTRFLPPCTSITFKIGYTFLNRLRA